MVTLSSLLLPILLSTVLVFIASSVIHMLLPHHKNDFAAMPDEDAVMRTLRAANVRSGEYMLPHASTNEERKSSAYQENVKRGPVAFVTVLPSGIPSMGKLLAKWFVFVLVVGIFAAYVAGRALPAGADYLDVFRFAGTTAFLAYTFALWPLSIFYGRSWGLTLKSTVDGFVYALLTAGVFGWLWPV